MAGDGFPLYICGALRPIRFNWAAIAQLRDRFGVDFQNEVNRGLMDQDVRILADVLAIGSGGSVTAAQIMDDSPPIMDAVTIISGALRFAYNGGVVKGAKDPLANAAAQLTRALREMFTRKRFATSSVV